MVNNISTQNESDQHTAFEQYKILVDSHNKLNEIRENSNNFWVATNGAGVSALAYLRDAQNIAHHHKPILLITIGMIGILFCVSWLSYLSTIKKAIEVRSGLLLDLEKNLPNAVFSKIFTRSDGEPWGKSTLTMKEMLVPSLFLMGYIFFAVLLFFFPDEAVAPSAKNHVSSNATFQRNYSNL